MTDNTLSGRGGTRTGAGRPKEENTAKRRSIRLTDEDYANFLKLGGAKWLREMIRNCHAGC